MQRRPFLTSLLAAILLIVITALAGIRQPQPLPTSSSELHFSARRALALTGELSTRFPLRNDLHPDRARAAQWLKEQFAAAGLKPESQSFSEVIASQQVDGLENVYAVVPGVSDEIVVVLAHYDIPPFVVQGAADDASGVGVVLELARLFSQEKPGRTLLFMATDSEEFGAMWGTISFLKQFPQREKIVAAISVDLLNMGDQAAISILTMGLRQGFTPPWLRQLSLDSAHPEGAVADLSPPIEWVMRSVAIPPTEHGIFLAEGIPAVNYRGVPADQAWHSSLYHTPGDRIDNLTVDSMAAYGRATERLLRSIAELPAIPRESGRYLGLPGGRSIAGWAITLIQLWLFLPLITALWRLGQQRRRKAALVGLDRRQEAIAGAKRLCGLFLPLGFGFALLKLLPEVGLMVKYEVYPATQKDPILYHPQWLPVLLVLGTVLISLWLIARRTNWLRGPESGWEERRFGLLTGLLGLVLAVWALGAGFAAVSFLTLPAYLWLGIRPGRRWQSIALWTLSTAVFIAVMLLFGTAFEIGVIWWYQLMAAAYGLFSPQAVLAFLAGFALHVEALSLAWGEKEAALSGAVAV